jgi:hypothetical protein
MHFISGNYRPEQDSALQDGDKHSSSGGLLYHTHHAPDIHWFLNPINSVDSIGFEVLTAVVRSSIYWNITPCSPLKVNRRFGETYRLHLQGRRISEKAGGKQTSYAVYFSTLKMEAICYSVTSLDFQRTTRRYVSEDGTFNTFLACFRRC